ncbi:MAG: carboxypeptidase regulatory-like domain-containing protein [Planctomycetes bacterium]|nr:carboxypeptidase regulatory-like domain-containing protein [Planctomycetota bacterium]
MRPRDLLILFGTLGLGASLGLVLMGSDTLALELPPPGGNERLAPVAAEATPNVPVEATVPEDDSAPVEAFVRRSDRPEAGDRVDTTGWTSGIVRGDVEIAVSCLDQIERITVVVEELRSPLAPDGRPFQRPKIIMQEVELGIGTPTFEVKDIPFSEYPYTVSLYVPGLNGGSRTITIDEKTKLREDLVLRITPGSPFSVLLRDQDRTPYAGVDVRLIPVGNPPGRPPLQATTNNFGSALFEQVLSGDYQVVTGQKGLPLATPEVINVQPGATMTRLGNTVQAQCYSMTIERGQALEVFALCGGYRVADVKVHLQATDRLKLTQLEAVTDYNGRAEFPHLTPGVWQIDFIKDDFQRATRQITIKDGQPPVPVEGKLVRLR